MTNNLELEELREEIYKMPCENCSFLTICNKLEELEEENLCGLMCDKIGEMEE